MIKDVSPKTGVKDGSAEIGQGALRRCFWADTSPKAGVEAALHSSDRCHCHAPKAHLLQNLGLAQSPLPCVILRFSTPSTRRSSFLFNDTQLLRKGQVTRGFTNGDERLSSRLIAMTRRSGTSYPCTYLGCSRTFASQRQLKVHAKTHEAAHPFVCLLCPKRFSTQSELQDHQDNHNSLSQDVELQVEPSQDTQPMHCEEEEDDIDADLKEEAVELVNNAVYLASQLGIARVRSIRQQLRRREISGYNQTFADVSMCPIRAPS